MKKGQPKLALSQRAAELEDEFQLHPHGAAVG